MFGFGLFGFIPVTYVLLLKLIVPQEYIIPTGLVSVIVLAALVICGWQYATNQIETISRSESHL